MKKIIIVFLLLLFNIVFLFSNDMELVHSFKWGAGQDELARAESGRMDMDDKASPNGMMFDSEGYLNILDTWNARILKYDVGFNLVDTIPVENGDFFLREKMRLDTEGNICGDFQSMLYSCVSPEGKLIFSYDLYSILGYDVLQQNSYLTYQGYFFYRTKSNRLFCIPAPNNDFEKTDPNRIIWDDDVYAMFEDDSGYDLGKLTLDQDGFFYVDSEPILSNYSAYANFWMRERGQVDSLEFVQDSRHKSFATNPNSTSMYYVGVDNDNNTYWCLSGRVIRVFDKNGFVIDHFRVDRSRLYITPAVSPEGDLYFFESADEQYNIYKMESNW